MVKLFVFLGGLASCMLAELGYCMSFGKNPTVAMQKKFFEIDIYKDFTGNCSRTAYRLENYFKDGTAKRIKIRSFKSIDRTMLRSVVCDSMRRGETRCLLHIQEVMTPIGGRSQLFAEACYDQGSRCLPGAKVVSETEQALSYKECSIQQY